MLEIHLPDDPSTRALGRALARALTVAAGANAGGVLCLSGHLGAGKTTLVKGLVAGRGLAAEKDVTSPTFLRLVRYEDGASAPLVHVDAYRMHGEGDVFELGLDEDLAGGALVVLEWPENIAAAIPADHLRVGLDHLGATGRRARLSAGGPESALWLTNLDLSLVQA